MNNNYKVYKHINKNNSKVYIGITTQKPERRWRKGEGYKKNIYFYRAIKKYGWDNFEHLILFDRLTKEEAESIEIELIKYHNSTNIKYGYNINNGGNTIGTHSQFTKQKMSENHADVSGRNNPMFGKHLSLETKLKLSTSKKGKYCGKDNHNYGKQMSEEQRKKISKTRIGLGLAKGKNNPNYGNGKEIICLQTKEIFKTISDASKKIKLDSTSIGRVCKGKQSHTGGYKFMYLEDYNKSIDTTFLRR